MRAGHARGAGADDGDFLARRSGASERLDFFFEEIIGREALELADGHGLVFARVADAGFLAKGFDRANAGAGSAHDVGVQNLGGGAFEIAGGDPADELRNVDLRRAGLDAGRVVAEVAARAFDGGAESWSRGGFLSQKVFAYFSRGRRPV